MKSHSNTKPLQKRQQHLLQKNKIQESTAALQLAITSFRIYGSNFSRQFSIITNIIDEMIQRKLMLDRITHDTFAFRHCATIYGTKCREKGGIWRKFDPGGIFRMLLQLSC